MCIECGCGERAPTTESGRYPRATADHHHHAHSHYDVERDHVHGSQDEHRCHRRRSRDSHVCRHDHGARQAHGGQRRADCSPEAADLTLARTSGERVIQIERDILAKNDRIAAENRARFLTDGLLVFNLVSSPGAGKTSLLVRALAELKRTHLVGVIEGDQQTSNDAERIRATGVPAIQINTGKGCHLDAEMVRRAYRRLPPLKHGILFIENVGNLVCPAAFDLGEACKIVIFSTPEGEDKPLKYPDMFAASSLMVINKVDLEPMVDFDRQQATEYVRRINPKIEVMSVSARSGEGVADLCAWIRRQAAHGRDLAEGTAR
ncbi:MULTISPECIES: hydrogenase nickel incorporation protein HypB [unclassified Bradyrhizobium]|uniref:hydrogenase nickel incorporation protein HypB n=1 Tax=unclassified Bradyrhizobium TaxID=2631580 RepID=UPI00247B03F7|nr:MULTISPECIES: hydrogenase nickel incorporation protein HypB [unclassified Bradyrhizobium]WGR98177.1 hydrogenase nickel incorporation protein HypB [Bradyrhizobium sp. ISRA436]WGS05066.1 hydrogenase nickel incorporation protein HypB [Bradyrhizobium sp. ISRA437]WGS11951.1 hydrogenase nickel incorporation protein HypB [Bradyrhizobium sp. ISRA443]WGS19414.1 hydrogenase nickel incorporation protein HypB [Bradyrhizobium sp. ISRA463]WGS26247.1 hydrogenase nickel incorporation protein HypB [Bradyrhi